MNNTDRPDNKPWAVSADGSIYYLSLTPKYLENALGVMRNAFFVEENVARAVGVTGNPGAIQELEELTLRAAKDGVSIIALDVSTGKVVGAAFNKLQVKDAPGEASYFENFAKACKNDSSKALVQFMIDADALCNLFDLGQVDCLLEIMFLATLPAYQRKGIASTLCRISITAAEHLLRGENIKQSLDGSKLPLEPVPKMVSAIFTAIASQKIGTSLGFTKAAEKSYEEFYVAPGKSYADVIGKETPTATLEYKKLTK